MKSWPSVFMEIARAISQRSKDEQTQCGAVIVDSRNRVISMGFNGPPALIPDGAVIFTRPHKYPFMVHAEDNAIHFGVEARGVDGLAGSTLYVTHRPCSKCMLNIVRARIAVVRYGDTQTAIDDWELTQNIAHLGGVTLCAST